MHRHTHTHKHTRTHKGAWLAEAVGGMWAGGGCTAGPCTVEMGEGVEVEVVRCMARRDRGAPVVVAEVAVAVEGGVGAPLGPVQPNSNSNGNRRGDPLIR